jgi:O-antigen ligase
MSRFMSRLLLILILLGPPLIREGRTAETVFTTDPFAGLNSSYFFHFGTWALAGLYVLFLLLTSRTFLRWVIVMFRTSPLASYVLFALLALVSATYSASPAYTAYFALKIWIALLLAVRVAQEAYLKGTSPIKALLKVVGLAYGIGLTMLVFLFFTKPDLVGDIESVGYRLTGGFLQDYGSFALVTGIFLLSSLLFAKMSLLGRYTLLFPLLLTYLFLVLSWTRNTIFIGVISLGLMVFYRKTILGKALLGVLLFILLIIVGGIFGQQILVYLARGETLHGLETLSARTPLFSFLMGYWSSSPLVGLGFQSGSRMAAVDYLKATGIALGAAHDALSKVLVDLGLLGAVVLGTTLVSFWRVILVFRRRFLPREWIITTSLGIYLTVSSIFSGGIADVNPLWLVMLVLCAWPFGKARLQPQSLEGRGVGDA